MHRLMVPTETLVSSLPELPKAAAQHLKVLRPESGEELELFDGRGAARRFRWDGARLEAAAPAVRMPAPVRSLVLFACVTKGSRWDWTVEKATEIGATRIVPVISERTIVRLAPAERAAKRERWERIAEDAVRQCDGYWLPEIAAAVDFREALELVKATDCYVGALTDPPSEPLAAAIRVRRDAGKPLAVFIGPEGDFTPAELAALVEVATPVSLGERILRAETAALYALSVVAGMLSADGRERK